MKRTLQKIINCPGTYILCLVFAVLWFLLHMAMSDQAEITEKQRTLTNYEIEMIRMTESRCVIERLSETAKSDILIVRYLDSARINCKKIAIRKIHEEKYKHRRTQQQQILSQGMIN